MSPARLIISSGSDWPETGITLCIAEHPTDPSCRLAWNRSNTYNCVAERQMKQSIWTTCKDKKREKKAPINTDGLGYPAEIGRNLLRKRVRTNKYKLFPGSVMSGASRGHGWRNPDPFRFISIWESQQFFTGMWTIFCSQNSRLRADVYLPYRNKCLSAKGSSLEVMRFMEGFAVAYCGRTAREIWQRVNIGICAIQSLRYQLHNMLERPVILLMIAIWSVFEEHRV